MAKRKTKAASVPKPKADLTQIEQAVVSKHMAHVDAEMSETLGSVAGDIEKALDRLRAFCREQDLNLDRAGVKFNSRALMVQVSFQLPAKWEGRERAKAIKEFIDNQ